MKALSILIPVYNDDVVPQVTALQAQCSATQDLEWEILVADDGSSPDRAAVNAPVADIPGCRILWRERNYGRSSTRNFLARAAHYDTLLYIDSGLKPSAHFIRSYAAAIGAAQVVCGTVGVDPESTDRTSLRWRNERRAQRRFTAAHYSAHPYQNFHTTAFMIARSVALALPFREDITTYGHEDTLFGKQLADRAVSIRHIDCPVLFQTFEPNARFLEKTREAIATLYAHRRELTGYSSLLSLSYALRRCHLLWLPRLLGRLLGRAMERNLCGKRPSLTLFDIWRVCEIAQKKF